MNKNSGALIKDIRNIQRSSPSSIITSIKELKKARLSEQINLQGLIETKNNHMKTIDDKIELHEFQIQKNKDAIDDLSSNFALVREQLVKQRQKAAFQEKKGKMLKEEMDRTNRMLRTKNLKIDQLNKQLEKVEKESQILKNIAQKSQEYIKTISNLRKNLTQNEETLRELKVILAEKQKELHRVREQVLQYVKLKKIHKEWEDRIQEKDQIIRELKSQNSRAEENQKAAKEQVNKKQRQIEKVHEDLLKQSKMSQKDKQKIQELETKYNQAKNKLSKAETVKDDMQSKLRVQESISKEYQQKYKEILCKYEASEQEHKYTAEHYIQDHKQIELLSSQLKKATNSLKEAQKNKEKMQQIEGAMNSIKSKSGLLKQLYSSVKPQVQCSFGHQLNEPVTIIPCGHNYCLNCRKGYIKECMQCKGKVKIDAVYRNELMDDIISMVKVVKTLIDALK